MARWTSPSFWVSERPRCVPGKVSVRSHAAATTKHHRLGGLLKSRNLFPGLEVEDRGAGG